MESKKGVEDRGGCTLLGEWEKPSVKELDINALTLFGPPGVITDGDGYS